MHAASHAERRTQCRTQSGRVSRGVRSRSTESRVPAEDQTARCGLVFLGTSRNPPFCVLSLLSLAAPVVAVSRRQYSLGRGRRRRRRYV